MDAESDSLPVTAYLERNAGLQLLGDNYESMLYNWKLERVTLEEGREPELGITCVVDEQVSDLEIYAFLEPDVNPERRECKSWDFRLSIKNTRTHRYRFPACRGKVYLVFPEPERSRSCSKKDMSISKELALISTGLVLIAVVILLSVGAIWMGGE